MNFPRLHDTDFPNLNNVNVYKYKNDFDYTRWAVGTTIKLCNVLWNSDYGDVVKFDTNIERDRYFDELEDYYTITLESAINYVPESAVKVPLPYDIAARYNYMVITIPVLPGTNPPINYEDEEIGIRRWYFFIDSIDYRSANATACRLVLDVWTQYQNDIDLKYMILERGHAPMAFSDVDEYLANPIENNDYLLAPDATPSSADVVRASNFIPFGNGVKYVCFASTCPVSRLSDMGTVLHNDPDYTYGNITYSDINVRHGYQLQVNGFKVGNGDNYTYLHTESDTLAQTQSLIPNGSYMYAIEAAAAKSFINKMMEDCPVFFRTVLACFMVDENMLNFGRATILYGYTVYECVGQNDTLDIRLTKEMFNYPDEYKKLAKLYTFPYSVIELTDNVGESVTVRVENTGNIIAHRDSMLAYPFLDSRIWFEGINGSGSQTYTWIDMNGNAQVKEMPNSDWSTMCFDLSIPCFALYMDAETAWYLDNFDSAIRGNGKRALASYHSAVRSANTARANAIDSNDTMYSNSEASADTMNANATNTSNTNRANADLTIAANTTNTNNTTATATRMYEINMAAAVAKMRQTNTLNENTSAVQAETTATTALNNSSTTGYQNLITGGLSGAAMGAAIGTAAMPGVGTVLGGVGSGLLGAFAAMQLGVHNAENNNALMLGAAAGTIALASRTNELNLSASNGAAEDCTDEENALKIATNTTNNNAYSAQTNNNNNLLRTNTGNNATTLKDNADATRDTGNANAGYTRDIGVLNAKENLEATQYDLQCSLSGSRMKAPVELTKSDGNYLPYYMGNNGVQMKIKTMPNGDVRQIGDMFLRYGYALNQMWDIEKSGLCPMPHFCFWRASDIWVDDRKSSNNSIQDIIINIFKAGVTVWRNPDEIGKVSIYDNE